MTQQEYEQKRYDAKKLYLSKFVAKTRLDNYEHVVFDFAFARGYALGKQKKDAEETVIHGWVARDKSGDLYMYHTKPLRNVVADRWRGESSDIDLYNNLLFPDLTWDSDPEEVEIIIKRKKNG